MVTFFHYWFRRVRGKYACPHCLVTHAFHTHAGKRYPGEMDKHRTPSGLKRGSQ